MNNLICSSLKNKQFTFDYTCGNDILSTHDSPHIKKKQNMNLQVGCEQMIQEW